MADYPGSDEAEYTPGKRAKLNKVQHIVGNARPGEKTSGNHGTPGWDQIIGDGLTKSWVQMHVLSEALGGKAVVNNLISAPGNVNTGYSVVLSWERRILRLYKKAILKM